MQNSYNTSKRIDVSIIIPCYGVLPYLNYILDKLDKMFSLANEKKGLRCEAIFVNDNPEDDGELEAIQQHGHIVILNKKNKGIHRSRVIGLKHASGEFILFWDQDDLLENDTILEQYSAISDKDAVVCNGYLSGLDGELKEIIYGQWRKSENIYSIDNYMNGNNDIISPGQVLIRRSSIPKTWIDCSLANNGADDYLLWVLMLHRKALIGYNNKLLYTHVNTGYNTSSNLHEMNCSLIEVKSVLEKGGINIGKLKLYPENDKRRIVCNDILNNKEHIVNWLLKHDYHKIAIYGCGMIGRTLFETIKDCADTEVKCFIERSYDKYVSRIPVVPIEFIENKVGQFSIDVVIITLMKPNEVMARCKKNFNSIDVADVIARD